MTSQTATDETMTSDVTSAEEATDDDDGLVPPSRELAQRAMRVVGWDERLEGVVFAAGPGPTIERLFRLTDAANMLRGMPSFSVSFGDLAKWVGEALGDACLAERIGAVCAGETAAPAAESPEERIRRCVGELLERRVTQFRDVLGLNRIESARAEDEGESDAL